MNKFDLVGRKMPKAPIMSGFYLKPGPSMNILFITISNKGFPFYGVTLTYADSAHF